MDLACNTNKCVLETAGVFVVVTLILVTGVIGSGVVLKIYSKEKKQASQIYIMALALIDLLGCLFVLPQIPFWQSGKIPVESPIFGLYMYVVIVQKQSYLFVQIAMVFDRIFAVFKPHSFNQLRRKTNKILLMIFVAVQITIQLAMITHYALGIAAAIAIVGAIHSIAFGLGLGVLVTAYPAIALKLWKQSRRIKPTSVNQQNQPSAATGNPNKSISESQQRTRHHIKILKLYVAILVIFLIGFLTALMLSIGNREVIKRFHWLSYVYYLNSVGNPFIYYVFNDKFRSDVKQMFAKSC